jgi:hypothetical protein
MKYLLCFLSVCYSVSVFSSTCQEIQKNNVVSKQSDDQKSKNHKESKETKEECKKGSGNSNNEHKQDNNDSQQVCKKDNGNSKAKEENKKENDNSKEECKKDNGNNKDENKKNNDDDSKKKTEEKKKEPESNLIKVGNLAFPQSQQPTPLISFGQNLLDESQVQWQGLLSYAKGRHEYFIEGSNSLIYAFKDDISLFLSMPNAIRLRQDDKRSVGPEDLVIQFEYAPYTKEFYTYYDQLSFVAFLTIPTGSIRKDPPTGAGANTYFFGGVYSVMGINWFYFVSYGYLYNGTSHRSSIGNQFLYQYGVGRRIFNTSEWLFDWILEFDGTLSGRDKMDGSFDPNTGGNIIYVTPSLFLASNKHIVLQLGIGFPVVQQLNGNQHSQEYLAQTKISWTF